MMERQKTRTMSIGELDEEVLLGMLYLSRL